MPWYVILAIGFTIGLALGLTVAVSWWIGFLTHDHLYKKYQAVKGGQETLRKINHQIRLAALGGRADPGAIDTEVIVAELRARLDKAPRMFSFEVVEPKDFRDPPET